MGEDRFAGPLHVRSIGIVAADLERVVGLDRGAHIEVAIVVEGPAAVILLDRTQISGQFLLKRIVNLSQEMVEKNVLCRNGGVGFQFEGPVPILRLKGEESLCHLVSQALDAG